MAYARCLQVPRALYRGPRPGCRESMHELTWQRNLPAHRRSRHESWCGLSPEGFTGPRKSSASRPATFVYQLQRLVRDGCLLVRIRGCDEIFAPREVQEQASDGIAWP